MKIEIRAHELTQLLDRLPGGVTTLSLDCFDTLLWRTVNAPRDVFAALDLPGGGVEPRSWAELGAYRIAANRGTPRVMLHDIYRHMLPRASDGEVEQRVTTELKLEAQHCFAFAPTVELMRRAKERGLEVVIVSDMYLSHAQLCALIAEAAGEDVLALADRIFVSSELGFGKADGLFDHVLAEIGRRPAQVVHVGDNPKADYEAADRWGMHSVLLRQFDDLADQRLRMEAAASMILDPTVRAAVPTYQFHRADVAMRHDDDPVIALGRDVMGPALHTFSSWIADEVASLSDRLGKPVRPLFLMRDGYLPFACFDAMFPELGAHAVELSRFVASRASLHNRDAVAEYVYDQLDKLPLETLARQLMLHGHEWQSVLRHKTDKAQRTAFARLALSPNLVRQIVARSARFADKLIAHLAATGVGPGNAVMLVDIGYKGTVQELLTPMLEDRLGLTVAGRYLFLRETQLSGLDKRGMIDVRTVDTRTVHALAVCVGVVEQLCNISQGSTIDFDAKGTPVRESLDIKATQSATRSIVQNACLDYINTAGTGTHRRAPSDTLANRVQASAGILARLMFLPSAAEVALFEDFDQDINQGTRQTARLLDAGDATIGLRRHGMSYMNDVTRMYVPAEIQRHGLPLNLSLFNTMRLALDLRTTDYETGGVSIAVILADATDQTLLDVTATPTADGYYRILVPVGAGRFTAAIPVGQMWEHVQVEDARFQRIEDLRKGRRGVGIAATVMTDAMVEQGDASSSIGVLGGVGQQIQEHLRQPGQVGVESNRLLRERDREFMAHLLDQRAARFDRTVHHGRQLHSLLAKFELATGNPAHVHQVINQSDQLRHLAFHHAAGLFRRLRLPTRKPNQLQASANRGEGIAQLVGQRRQKLVLAAIGFRQVGDQLMQLALHPLALDAESDPSRCRCQGFESRFAEGLAGEHGDDADQPIAHNQRIASEGDESFPPRPFLLRHTGITLHTVGQMGLSFLGDLADLELAERNPTMRPVEVSVQPGAGLQVEGGKRLVQSPDAGKGPVEVLDQRLGAGLQHGPQRSITGQSNTDLGLKSGMAQPLRRCALRFLTVGDVAQIGREPWLAVVWNLGHGKFDRELTAICAEAGHLKSFAENAKLTRLQDAIHAVPMPGTQGRGNDDFIHRSPD